MANSSGSLFRITSFGESHGPALGVVIDGCPAGLRLDLSRVQEELDRRRPGASPLSSTRKEPDRVELLSGVDGGLTLGSPIALLVRNLDARPADYEPGLYRPGHADLSHELRTGQRPGSGGGRASARETVARVAAGAVARQVLEALVGPSLEILAWVEQVGEERAACRRPARQEIEQSPVRCPQPEASARMEARIRAVRAEGDSLGGVIRGQARGVPAGLGQPVFGKIEAELAAAMLSIPAAKGFESGSGYAGAARRGSENNDPLEPAAAGEGGQLSSGAWVRSRGNHAGGLLGGISTGMDIDWTVAFKPVSTIFLEQDTVDAAGQPARLRARGRHDPCVLPRAVPIVEAMAALVLCDQLLRARGLRPLR